MRPYSAKTAAHKRAMQAQDEAFHAEFDWCAVCNDRLRLFRHRLHRHHIVGGGLKSTLGHRRENWIMLCQTCHDQVHKGGLLWKGERLPPLYHGNIVWAKSQVDKSYFDLAVIKFLLHGPKCKELINDWTVRPPHEFYLGA